MNTFDRPIDTPPIATPPVENPYDTVTLQHERLEREERERAMRRFGIPLLTGFVCLLLGFAVGWSGGRADLLENTFVRDGAMVTHTEPVATETVPVEPRVGPDRVGER